MAAAYQLGRRVEEPPMGRNPQLARRFSLHYIICEFLEALHRGQA